MAVKSKKISDLIPFQFEDVEDFKGVKLVGSNKSQTGVVTGEDIMKVITYLTQSNLNSVVATLSSNSSAVDENTIAIIKNNINNGFEQLSQLEKVIKDVEEELKEHVKKYKVFAKTASEKNDNVLGSISSLEKALEEVKEENEKFKKFVSALATDSKLTLADIKSAAVELVGLKEETEEEQVEPISE